MTINDPNRGYGTPRDPNAMRDGTSTTTWGIIAVLAVLIIGGLFFYNSGSAPDRTASNAPAVTHTTPAPSPGPAPVTTPPAAPKK